MQDTERQKFEESWKKAFDGAKSTPPDHVWNSIELDLAGDESAAMKKKVVFYQRLAAAMLIFGLLAGSYGFYASSGNDRAMSNEQRATSNVQRSTDNDSHPVQQGSPIVATVEKKQKQIHIQQQIAFAEETTEPVIVEEPIADQPKKVEEKEEEKTEEKKIAEVVVSPLLQKQEETPETVVEPKHSKRPKESLWLALGGSAGNYTPNTPTATTPTISQSSFDSKGPILAYATTPSAPKPQPKIGSSYSVGVGVGKKFGRFVVQMGVNLNKQQINYTSNYDTHTSSNTAMAAMSDYIGQSNLTFTNEYTVSSTMDIVSIPVQLGYMIIDRRLGWQINGGVSNDFFLRNVLVDKSGQRSRFTQEAGSESPYRSVNWSALASTELSYRIGQHYRVSLVPGARYSVHSILKDDKNTGRPVVLDVGFRFRYIFD